MKNSFISLKNLLINLKLIWGVFQIQIYKFRKREKKMNISKDKEIDPISLSEQKNFKVQFYFNDKLLMPIEVKISLSKLKLIL